MDGVMAFFMQPGQIQQLRAAYANYWADPTAINYILLSMEFFSTKIDIIFHQTIKDYFDHTKLIG